MTLIFKDGEKWDSSEIVGADVVGDGVSFGQVVGVLEGTEYLRVCEGSGEDRKDLGWFKASDLVVEYAE